MQNMMNDIWKDMEMMKAFDFTKSFDLSKGMNPSTISLQVIDFQKNAFNKTYELLMQIQDQSEKIVDTFMKNSMVPDEGRKMLDEWRLAFKHHRDELKNAIDDGFIKVEAFFCGMSEPQPKASKPKASEPQSKKMNEAKKEESDTKKEMAKASPEESGLKKEAAPEKEKAVKEPQAKKEK